MLSRIVIKIVLLIRMVGVLIVAIGKVVVMIVVIVFFTFAVCFLYSPTNKVVIVIV